MPELKKLDLNETIVPTTQTTSSTAPTVNTNKVTNSNTPNMSTKKGSPILFFLVIAILLGVGTGYAVNKYILPSGTISDPTAANIDSSSLKIGDIIGATDKSAFKDETEGVLEKGGISGEGSHHLLKPGGPSQTVYLTSSVVDLDALVGHKIHVWGETFDAQKAGWLMDVGRIEVLELNAQKPE